MGFWAYLLHCRGGAFYAGHTDDLERRVAEHREGAIPGFTADRRPIALVWSEQFATRLEAQEAERRIKGWSRAKKMALIRGDWSRLETLAKGNNGPSTGSGRAAASNDGPFRNSVCPELVEGPFFTLTRHFSNGPTAVDCIVAALRNTSSGLILAYDVSADIDDLVIPPPSAPSRADGLWRTTCFEAFVRQPDGSYVEYNFSPSGEWAAYRFASYRSGMRPLELAEPPRITIEGDERSLQLAARLTIADLRPDTRLGLSAVIEQRSGAKSYWALAHPPGPPDFHHEACFALALADIGRP